jgi:hypothetical protein
MTSTFDDIAEAIYQQTCALHVWWILYQQLFSSGERRVELLNEFVPEFGATLQELLADVIILGICRLCDPAKQRKFENMSLEYLLSQIQPAPSASEASHLAGLLSAIGDSIKPLQDHRNKRLAHHDRKRALSSIEILPGVTLPEINEILAKIRKFLNTIESYGQHKLTDYENIPIKGDGNTFIWALQKARKLGQLEDAAYSRKMSNEEIISALMDRSVESI